MTTSCTQCDFKTTSDYYQSSHTSIILSASSHKWLLPFCPRLLGFQFLALLKLKETEWKTTASLFASSGGSCREKYVSHSIIWKDTCLDLKNPSLCLAPCPLPRTHSELPVFPLNPNICSACRHLPDNDFLYNDSCHSCCKQSLLSDSNNVWHTILSLKDKNSSQESSLQGRDSDQLGAELNPAPRCLHPLLHSSTDEGSMGASRTPASEVRDGLNYCRIKWVLNTVQLQELCFHHKSGSR